MKGESEMAVTQQQIADLSGVPRTTVSRILNDHPNVNPETAERVRKIADELGYKPSRAGNLLRRAKRPIRLGVVLQSTRTPFMQNVVDEVEAARTRAAQSGAELLVCLIEDMNANAQLQHLEALEQAGIDGLMLTPIEDDRIFHKINALVEKNIPVVTSNTDMPSSNRLCYVGQDNRLSGQTCAGLMDLLLCGRGKVLVVAGHSSIRGQQERIAGFVEEMQQEFPEIEVLPTEFCCEEYQLAYDIVYQRLQADPTIGGIYFTSDGPSGACQAIRDLGLTGKIRFVCHDTTSENIQNMQARRIHFLIDQDARAQALKPIQILLDKILDNVSPEKEYMFTRIDIRNRYNILSESIF